MTPEQNEPLSYWTALARSVFEEDIYRLMEKKKLSQAGLAHEMAVSEAHISRLLRGSNNYQLITMAKIARALDAVLEVRLADEKTETTRVLSFAEAGFVDDRLQQEKDFPNIAADNKVLLFVPRGAGPGYQRVEPDAPRTFSLKEGAR